LSQRSFVLRRGGWRRGECMRSFDRVISASGCCTGRRLTGLRLASQGKDSTLVYSLDYEGGVLFLPGIVVDAIIVVFGTSQEF
jgi:hypothetical protein